MKIPNRLLSIETRDKLLEDFYKNRNFLQFVHGEEYFNSQVEKVFALWLKGPAEQNWGNDLVIERVAWEHDNGYLEDTP